MLVGGAGLRWASRVWEGVTMRTSSFLIAVLACASTVAHADTIYVNWQCGDDAWSGHSRTL